MYIYFVELCNELRYKSHVVKRAAQPTRFLSVFRHQPGRHRACVNQLERGSRSTAFHFRYV